MIIILQVRLEQFAKDEQMHRKIGVKKADFNPIQSKSKEIMKNKKQQQVDLTEHNDEDEEFNSEDNLKENIDHVEIKSYLNQNDCVIETKKYETPPKQAKPKQNISPDEEALIQVKLFELMNNIEKTKKQQISLQQEKQLKVKKQVWEQVSVETQKENEQYNDVQFLTFGNNLIKQLQEQESSEKQFDPMKILQNIQYISNQDTNLLEENQFPSNFECFDINNFDTEFVLEKEDTEKWKNESQLYTNPIQATSKKNQSNNIEQQDYNCPIIQSIIMKQECPSLFPISNSLHQSVDQIKDKPKQSLFNQQQLQVTNQYFQKENNEQVQMNRYVRINKRKNNKDLLMNAISSICLAGEVNKKEREFVLVQLEEAEADHFVILFKSYLNRMVEFFPLIQTRILELFTVYPPKIQSFNQYLVQVNVLNQQMRMKCKFSINLTREKRNSKK